MARTSKDYATAAFAPDFFIVGAARCGTTALHSWLKPHPRIRMTDPDKEPGYYCDFWGTETFEEYRRNFSGATGDQLLGDASTHYMTSPNTPAIIHQANPDAKIIISLRHPADRAFSLFRFMKSQGYETIRDFDEALAAESARAGRLLQPDGGSVTYPYNYLYFRSGCYPDQLERYFQTFPADQILVLIFEEWIRQPDAAYGRILAHLGLPAESPAPTLARENSSWEPRSLGLQQFLKLRLNPLCKSLRLPHHAIYQRLSRWNRDESAQSSMNPATRSRLAEAYQQEIQRTEEILGRPLDAWH